LAAFALLASILAAPAFNPAVYAAQGDDVIGVIFDENAHLAQADPDDGEDTGELDDAGAAFGAAAQGGSSSGAGGGWTAEAALLDYPDLSARYADLTQVEKALILYRLGVLKGDVDGSLMLDMKVRRSDAAVFFTRLLGREQYVVDRAGDEFASTRFPDSPDDAWFTPYIAFCTSIGIIVGRDDGYYYPDDTISEKEFANVLLKILGYEYNLDYNWNTVYEFAYDIGLFDDPAYATRTEDNREYFRRDVCEQVFAVLSLEKRDSTKLLIEELVESGAIIEATALELGFDLSGLSYPGFSGGGGYPDFADIYGVYHLEPDLLWVVFNKPVSFHDEAVMISQTYDFSEILNARVETKTSRDALLRTDGQKPNMEYMIDISNVLEMDGTNAGMLSFEFWGYDPRAQADSPGGLTSLTRDVNNLPGSPLGGEYIESAGGGGNADGGDGSSGTSSGQTQQSGWAAGNADPSVEYFRIINAYTTAYNELLVYFSHPITDAATVSSLYTVLQGGTVLSNGAAGQIKAEIVENSVNAVLLTVSGLAFTRGSQYRLSVGGNLISSYTAALNEGAGDAFNFTAEIVTERNEAFALTSVEGISQYGVELEFTQPLDADVAQREFNYVVTDYNGRRQDVLSVNIASGPASAGGGSSGARVVRLNLSQPLFPNQGYELTVVFSQNFARTETIVNRTYPFQYSGRAEAVLKSTLALTGAVSYDPSSVELYFNQKLDPVSAVINSNYTINGMFGGVHYSVNPVKASYDPQLTPFMVRLYFQSDRKFEKDRAYSIRIGNTIRDEKRTSPEHPIEMQFFASNRDPAEPVLKDAVIVGDGVVRLDFVKEIQFDPARITDGNFRLIDMDGGAAAGNEQTIMPILAKYIDSTTVILRFSSLDASRRYRVYFISISDFSGQYTTRYPDHGSSVAVRNGKR